MKKLAESCVYTIALPWSILEASREGTPLVERKPWVSASRLLKQAQASDLALPVVFADARDCSKLIAWSVLTRIEVGQTRTRYYIDKVWGIGRSRRPQALRLLASGKHIAPDFIRPYALCRTPDFLKQASNSPRPYCYGYTEAEVARSRRRGSTLDAEEAVRRAWKGIVRDCRLVLGSELHYQAMVYHCLRTDGRVPIGQLGMNVKMWIDDVTSAAFKKRDRRKSEAYRGGFEPIPDVVIFSKGVRGDWRRRNNEATLKHMIGAIEIKASERAGKGLSLTEVTRDIEKIAAHRAEKKHRWKKEFYAAVLVIDTAPKGERMDQEEVEEMIRAGRENRVDTFYISQDAAIPSERTRSGHDRGTP